MKLLRIVTVVATVLAALVGPAAGHAAPRARTPAETVLNDSLVRLSAGGAHTCHVNEDGTVRCWGRNSAGQLGDGTTTDRPTPVAVSGLSGAVAVAAGGAHTCALLAAGTARCWGANSDGQLGDGTTTQRPTPVSVSGLTAAVAITAGGGHTCALLSDGSGRCWGNNFFGQLGDGSTTGRPTPVQVQFVEFEGFSPVPPRFVALAAGFSHTCALRVDGTARCWGNNTNGQLGDGSTDDRPIPGPVPGLTGAVALAAGGAHTCALLAAGGARCWGNNEFGQLGDGSTTGQRPSPGPVPGLAGAVALTAGLAQTCALVADGSPRCWGFNGDGQLGDGSTTDRRTPVPVFGLAGAVALATGGADVGALGHTCALVADGSARCWGDNSAGQLGNGTTSDSPTPATVAGGGGSVLARDLAAGSTHTCAVRAEGTVACWGANGAGQLGDGTTTPRPSPGPVPGLTGAVALAAGQFHTCALLPAGTARCWGLNLFGQLGDGSTTDRRSPTAVPGLADAVALAAGGQHTCALFALGLARCWGANAAGQLGDGSTTDRHTPVQVEFVDVFPGLNRFVALAAGGQHTCALLASGTVRCWGANDFGQLGDGGTTDRPTPGPVPSLADSVALTAGGGHTCALLVDGTVRCWGLNFSGQLGDGTTADRFTPTTVVGLTGAVALAAGERHTCALLADGTARCWGGNENGQLGDGSTTQRLSPSTVTIRFLRPTPSGGTVVTAPLANVAQLAAGHDHTCALLAGGAVRCRGRNNDGQLGIGNTTDQHRPVAVPSFTLNIDPRVVLRGNARVATVQVLAICEAGQQLHAEVTLTQDGAAGRGIAAGQCTGALTRYPVTVPAQGGQPFVVGLAQAAAQARLVERGVVVDTQEWTRRVQIVSGP